MVKVGCFNFFIFSFFSEMECVVIYRLNWSMVQRNTHLCKFRLDISYLYHVSCYYMIHTFSSWLSVVLYCDAHKIASMWFGFHFDLHYTFYFGKSGFINHFFFLTQLKLEGKKRRGWVAWWRILTYCRIYNVKSCIPSSLAQNKAPELELRSIDMADVDRYLAEILFGVTLAISPDTARIFAIFFGHKVMMKNNNNNNIFIIFT